MKHLYSKILLSAVMFFAVFFKVQAQVPCGSCTSNDFTFNSFYLGDASGNALSSSCTIGNTVNAYLWINVTNSSTRYSLKVYYDLIETNAITNVSTTTTVNNCLYEFQAIPNALINLGPITYTCGNSLTMSNFQMHWKQNNSLACSFDAPKCLCQVTSTVVKMPLVPNFSYVGCNNGSNTTVNFTSAISGGTAPYTYSWAFGDAATSTLANPSHVYTNPGPYTATLTVTDSTGAVRNVSYSVTLPAQLAAPTVSSTQPTCSVNTGSITISNPIGVGYTYSIDGVNYQASALFSSVAPGTYNVTYKSTSNCPSTATSVTLTAAASPAAPTVSITQPTCATATGTITVTSPVGAGLTYSIDGINYQTSTTFSSVASGSYNVTVRNGVCTSTATVATVNAQPATPAAPTVSITQPTCATATGTITVSAPVGVGLTYSRDGLNYQASITFSGVAAGNYNITVRNTSNCTSTATVATVNAQPTTPAAPTVSVTQPTCATATGTITVTAPLGVGLTYSIDGVNYQASTTFSSVGAGNYNVTVRNASNCTSAATVATVNAQPATPAAPTVSITQPTCATATGTITVTAPVGAGLTYSRDGINYQASTTFSGVAAGNYNITVRNTSNCTSTATVATVNAQPASPASPTVSITQPTCATATGTITITAPLGVGLTYSIDGVNYQASTTFSSVSAGNYNVTVRNASNCTSTATVATVNAQPATPATPTIMAGGPTTFCAGGSVTLTSSSATGNQWYLNGVMIPGATNNSITVTSSGNYTVIVTNGSGCSSAPSLPTTVTVNANPTVNAITGNSAVCVGNDITLSSTTVGGVWSSSNNAIATVNAATGVVTGVSAGSVTINYTVTNGSGCSTIVSKFITVQGAVTATITPSIVGSVCAGSGYFLTANPSGAAGYQWYLNGVAIPGATAQTYSPTLDGSYTVEITNAAGCMSTSAPIVVTFVTTSGTTINVIGNNPICAGNTVQLCPSTWGWSNYQWYKNGVALPAPQGISACITLSSIDAGSYTLAVQNGAGCWSNQCAAVAITVGSAPATPVLNITQPACSGNTGTITITSPVGAGLLYSIDGVNYQASNVFNSIAVGTYTVYVKNALGCTASTTAIVANSGGGCNMTVTFTINNASQCLAGNSYQFTSTVVGGSGTYTYDWDFGDGTHSNLANPTHTYAVAGEYDVHLTVYEANGCPCTAHANTQQMYVGAKPTPSFSINISNCNQVTFNSTSTVSAGWMTYYWDLGNGSTSTLSNPTVTYAAGVYTVKLIVTSNLGCKDSITQNITIPVCPSGGGGGGLTCSAGWYSQPATSNCDSTLTFIASGSNAAGTTYTWYFGDGTTGTGTPINHKYATTGSFTVKLVVNTPAPACSDSVSYAIWVSDCSVSGGGGGGTESKSLGDVIAQRLFGNAKNNKLEVDGRKTGNIFNNKGMVVNGTQDISLSALMPTSVTGTNAAYNSSPTDLTTFTNAVEVVAVDYTNNSRIKAVAFGTKTLSDVYAHTKPICDRLKGAELLEVKNIMVKGYKLMAYKVRQRTGEVEYAMNLSAGTSSNRGTISLQSNWFTNSYVQDENLYNFQLWAVNYQMVTEMANSIIDNLQANGSVTAFNNADLPNAYISKGKRNFTNLNLTIQNNTGSTNGYFEIKEKANENTQTITTRQIPFSIAANGISNVDVAVKDNYEGNVYVYINNKLTDLVYMADGAWNIDFDKNTTSISKFDVVNENISNLTSNATEHRLLRNVELNAVCKDYVTIYKTMLGGGVEQNLTNYNALSFTTNASGASSVTIRFIKKSITNYSEHYSYTLNLESGTKDYVINFNKLKSSAFTDAISANDITAVCFSFNNNRGSATAMNINLSNAKFGKVAIAAASPAVVAAEVPALKVSPNPSNGKFTTTFSSTVIEDVQLNVVELASGKVLKTINHKAVKGNNVVTVDLTTKGAISGGMYIINFKSDSQSFKPAKMVIGH